MDDPDLRFSIDLYLAISNASQAAYNNVQRAYLRRNPDHQILSYDQIKRKIVELTGVVSMKHDMCINSCHRFTGPLAHLDTCTKCSELRYDQVQLRESGGKLKVPRQEFLTIPLGPQLQALRRTTQGAENMRHRELQTTLINTQLQANGGKWSHFEDIYYGSDYLGAVRAGHIKPEDTVLLLSLDGAQLIRNKVSDCWIYIWVILDLPPDLRYKKKHVLPGGFIPGPNKPKVVDSSLFPGLHHLQALQNEGLRVWDASKNVVYTSNPFLALGTADGPRLAYLNGLVGPTGAKGCRLHCPLKGRHKMGATRYYPALLKPDNYCVPGSDHPDYDIRWLPPVSEELYRSNLVFLQKSPNPTQYAKRRLITGISKPSLLSGISRSMGIPRMFSCDQMHLDSLNIPDLLFALWCGMIDCSPSDHKSTWDWMVLVGTTWRDHGKDFEAATSDIPGCFDCAPQNPTEKMSSGYKAREFLTYVYGLAPALLRKILPRKYWRHFCKLVFATRLLHQRSISTSQLQQAHRFLIEYVEEFELLYYQRRADRLHFCRQSIHALVHLAPEVARLGPLVYYTQWTMERTIGNLGEEVKQPSNPYQNISQRGLRRSQVNTLKVLIPDLELEPSFLPRGAQDLGGGFALLTAKDGRAQPTSPPEALAISQYMETQGEVREDWDKPLVTRWARLRLPTRQVARSLWRELLATRQAVWASRNVKVSVLHDETVALALISLYSCLDAAIWESSFNTVWWCQYQGDAALVVVEVTTIESVVRMVLQKDTDGQKGYFVLEQPGLNVLGGVAEQIPEE
ncbi:hypothetical protein JAAARDRAFT_182367 [Jaapia argillacea MUCL 33604]|uniref:Uncharacterized protein n=1 Tax=Jaapia argillacea MUCL 33604 TaxID=933084 RepID=A0A067PI20_9AGAM|nr:hypothetical protein JAAARDRAFT_182367 [Jaapia argillacea MUCL 33604]